MRYLRALGLVMIWGGCVYALEQDSAEKLGTKAIGAMRASKGYRVRYKTEMNDGNGKPFSISGTATVINPDIFYTHYTGSGGVDKKVILKGGNALIEHPTLKELETDPLNFWLDPASTGDNDAGIKGHNPDQVLTVIKNYLGQAKRGDAATVEGQECQTVAMEFRGVKIRDIVAEQGIKPGEIDWEKSTLTCRLSIGKKDSLIHQAHITASLANAGGRLSYDAVYTLLGVGEGLDLKEVPDAVLRKVGITPSSK